MRSCRRHAGSDGPAVRADPRASAIPSSSSASSSAPSPVRYMQVIAMALISMPVMIRYGYNIRYITGVLAASGTITQLVPSLVLIVMADQLGKSSATCIWAHGPIDLPDRAVRRLHFRPRPHKPDHVPAGAKGRADLRAGRCGAMPARHHPLGRVIFVVLGTMMMGLATPTEAGAMGAIGAIVLAAIHSKDLQHDGPQGSDHRRHCAGIEASSRSSIAKTLLPLLSLSPTSPLSGFASRLSAFPSCAT